MQALQLVWGRVTKKPNCRDEKYISQSFPLRFLAVIQVNLVNGSLKKETKKTTTWESPGGAAGKLRTGKKVEKISFQRRENGNTASAQFPKQRLEHLAVSPGKKLEEAGALPRQYD